MTHSALRIEYAALAKVGLAQWGARAANRAYHRLHRVIANRVVRDVLEAYAAGDLTALSHKMARKRAAYLNMDRPPEWRMQEAMRGVRIGEGPGPAARTAWMEGPKLNAAATLVYVPGGSFVVSRSPRVTAMIARVAKAARFRTLICDYRLAPEHPCPAAADDVTHAIEALLASGVPPHAIGLIAESAGAAVALSAAQRLRAAGIRLGAHVYFSPWTDLTLSGLSLPLRVLSADSQFSMESMAACAHLYLQGRRAHDPAASPVFGDLSGLAPTLIHTSRTDSLHGDAQCLAKTASDAGTPVTLRIWPSGNHVFERFYGASAEASIADAAGFLRAHLAN